MTAARCRWWMLLLHWALKWSLAVLGVMSIKLTYDSLFFDFWQARLRIVAQVGGLVFVQLEHRFCPRQPQRILRVSLFVCEKPSDSCRIADSSRNMADLVNCVVLGSYASSSVSALNFVSLPLPKDGDNCTSQKRWLRSKLVGWFYAHLKDAEIS